MAQEAVTESLKLAVSILGNRWRIILICTLSRGAQRFSDVQKELRISRRTLTVNLRALENAGLILRTVYAEVPPRVEYSLTPEGMELRPLIDMLCAWGRRFHERRERSVAELFISSSAE